MAIYNLRYQREDGTPDTIRLDTDLMTKEQLLSSIGNGKLLDPLPPDTAFRSWGSIQSDTGGGPGATPQTSLNGRTAASSMPSQPQTPVDPRQTQGQTSSPVGMGGTETGNWSPMTARVDPGAGSASPWPWAGVGQLTLRGPNGETQVVDSGNYQQVDQLTRSGWTPLSTNGQPMQMANYQGGQMFYNPDNGQWSPLNAILGGSVTPEQQAAMPGFLAQAPSITSTPGTSAPAAGGGVAGGTGNTAGGGNFAASGNEYGLTNNGELSMPGIPSINVPQPEQISSQFSPGFQNSYTGFMNTIGNQMGQQYGYQTPTATASEMNTGGIPQPGAQSFNISPELQSMLSGQGYDPKTLAQMRSSATEDASGAGRVEMAQAKRSLEQAGLGASPAGAAITGDVARRTGIEQNSALRQIDINDALQGIQNKQFGIGQQSNIGLSNMQQANQMAVENANRLFSGMSQNLANQQQSNMAQYGAEVNKKAQQANVVSGFLGQQGNNFNNASLNKATNAETQNVANQQAWAQVQANLERQRAMTNQAGLNNRYAQSQQALFGGGSLGAPPQQPPQSFNPVTGQ